MTMSGALQEAKQDRSRETLENILRATRELLRTQDFESITIRKIIKKAGTSIGSFYARFRDKDALLPVLYAEYESRLRRKLTALENETETASSLRELAAIFVDHIIDIKGEIPNLSRALFEYATREPDSKDSKDLSKRRMSQYGFIFKAFLRFEDEIQHPDPERGIELGIYFTVTACRIRLLYPKNPQTRTLKLNKPELREELQRLLCSYLLF